MIIIILRQIKFIIFNHKLQEISLLIFTFKKYFLLDFESHISESKLKSSNIGEFDFGYQLAFSLSVYFQLTLEIHLKSSV